METVRFCGSQLEIFRQCFFANEVSSKLTEFCHIPIDSSMHLFYWIDWI